MPKPRARTLAWTIPLALVLIGTIAAVVIANGPDRDVLFVRTVPAVADFTALAKSLDTIPIWPQWHHNMKEVQLVDGRGLPYPSRNQIPVAGGKLVFKVEPPTRQWKRFEMTGDIVEFVPGKMIRVALTRDSTGRITNLFDRVEWKVEVLRADQVELRKNFEGPVLRGTLTARTNHWRSRLITTVSERIVLNQIFYPDLSKLADLKRPSGPADLPQGQQ